WRPATPRSFDAGRIRARRRSGRVDGHLRTPRLEERGTRRRPKKRKFGMEVGRRPEDTPRFFLEPGSNEEIRFHAERSEIPGVARTIRLARGDGEMVAASRARRLSSVE